MLSGESDAGRLLNGAVIGLALMAASVACGVRQRVPPAPDPIPGTVERADREVRAGCYRCLERAVRLYSQVPPGHPASAAAARGRLGALLLLTARTRELGLPDTSWLALTREAVAASDDPLAVLRLEIVTRIHRPAAAVSPEQLQAEQTAARQGLDAVAAAAAAHLARLAAHDPVDAYVLLALACQDPGATVPGPEALAPAIASVPLVAFKIGACWREHRDALERAFDAEPRFAEARAWRGAEALRQGRLITADRELRAALDAFPDLAMAALTLGEVAMLLEEPAAAAAAFDRVLARVPDQPQALVGRTRALTYLGRATGAIATADRLLAEGTWFQGEAHYWRAWNLRRLRRLEEAAEAVVRADALLFNAAVPKLAGFIAYERDLLDQAQRELEASLERNASDCEVLFGHRPGARPAGPVAGVRTPVRTGRRLRSWGPGTGAHPDGGARVSGAGRCAEGEDARAAGPRPAHGARSGRARRDQRCRRIRARRPARRGAPARRARRGLGGPPPTRGRVAGAPRAVSGGPRVTAPRSNPTSGTVV